MHSNVCDLIIHIPQFRVDENEWEGIILYYGNIYTSRKLAAISSSRATSGSIGNSKQERERESAIDS